MDRIRLGWSGSNLHRTQIRFYFYRNSYMFKYIVFVDLFNYSKGWQRVSQCVIYVYVYMFYLFNRRWATERRKY